MDWPSLLHGPAGPPLCMDWPSLLHGPASPPLCMDWPSLLHGPAGPPLCMDWPSLLHGPASPPICMDWPSSLFLRFFRQEVLLSMYTLHHPYICPCFWRKHFYTPFVLALSLLDTLTKCICVCLSFKFAVSNINLVLSCSGLWMERFGGMIFEWAS